ncbi:MAG: hypothetical protein AAFO04_07065 [Cyanobacteria bacterium J06592_8]
MSQEPPVKGDGGSRYGDPTPPVESDGGSRFGRSWRDSFNDNEPPEWGDGGSRGGPFCALTPFDETTDVVVWSTRPTIIWQGGLARVELYPHNRDELLWSENLNPGEQQVQYTGEPLQPGQSYDIMFYESVDDAFPFPSVQITFKVMAVEPRQQVTQELEELTTQLQSEGASEEIIALARFNYFAEKQLWSDALTEAFSVENPSPELQQLREETIPQKFCN